MQTREERAILILQELQETIMSFLSQGLSENAELLLDQLIKLFPKSRERYNLQAIFLMQKKENEKAAQILEEGISRHPLDADLLYNLAWLWQEEGKYFDAYNMYMKALYAAESLEQMEDIKKGLSSLVEFFNGEINFEDGKVVSSLVAGEKQLIIREDINDLKERREILTAIRNNLDKEADQLLEIAFREGIISKNLNYYGYNVTAVDRYQIRILNIIAKEWHDNILQAGQKTAKFYNEEVSLDWLGKIPGFDVILVVSKDGLEAFASSKEKEKEILEALLSKANQQLFIGCTDQGLGLQFKKENIEKTAQKYNWKVKEIYSGTDGYKMILLEKKETKEHFKLPFATEAIYSRSTVLRVSLDKCRDLQATAYINDFHPFVEVLKEYEKKNDLKYENSILKKFYDNFQPKNSEEAFFVKKGRAPGLRKGWTNRPWDNPREGRLVFVDKAVETRLGGNHFHGPNTEEFGESEFKRLVKVYNTMKNIGYYPEMFTDGYITGYLLLKENDYRFVVTEGQHRVAALAALGYNEIVCRFNQRDVYPQIVKFEGLKKWRQVANGFFNRPLATKIFERFFEENVGWEKMRS